LSTHYSLTSSQLPYREPDKAPSTGAIDIDAVKSSFDRSVVQGVPLKNVKVNNNFVPPAGYNLIPEAAN